MSKEEGEIVHFVLRCSKHLVLSLFFFHRNNHFSFMCCHAWLGSSFTLLPCLHISICNCYEKPEHICIMLPLSQYRIQHFRSQRECYCSESLARDECVYFWFGIILKPPCISIREREVFMRWKLLCVYSVFFTKLFSY